MAQSLSLRATSLAVSAALLGAAAAIALTVGYALPAITLPFDSAPIEMEIEPPPPPLVRPETPRAASAIPNAEVLDPWPSTAEVAGLEPISISGAELGPPGPATIERPHWLRRPNNLQRYYPRRALDAGIQGDVALDCLVRVSGLLDCMVASETPSGRGFGEAALRIAADHRMAPALRDGIAVEGRYRMRVPFRVE